MKDAQSTEKQQALVLPAEDVQISAQQEPPESRIKTAIKKPGTLLSNALGTIKGRDLETLIEEFSSDVTLVLGGLSDDQERLGHENQRLREESDKLKQQLSGMEKRIKELEKSVATRSEKDGLLRRLTWLATVVIGGVALLYILKFLLT